MSVEFDDSNYSFDKNPPERFSKGTPIINFLIKNKLAKTPAQANLVMIGLCVICIIAAIAIVKSVI